MRIRHWGTWGFGCIMGLLPLIAWFLAQRLTGGRGIIGPDATREILFFALSTSSTAILSLGEDEERTRSQLWTFFALILTIISALSYGELLTGDAVHAALRVRFAYHFSVSLAVATFFYGALVEGITQPRSSQ
jgi:tellurite resistance protein TehA-like permease